jgi:hypothetical protein
MGLKIASVFCGMNPFEKPLGWFCSETPLAGFVQGNPLEEGEYATTGLVLLSDSAGAPWRKRNPFGKVTPASEWANVLTL